MGVSQGRLPEDARAGLGWTIAGLIGGLSAIVLQVSTAAWFGAVPSFLRILVLVLRTPLLVGVAVLLGILLLLRPTGRMLAVAAAGIAQLAVCLLVPSMPYLAGAWLYFTCHRAELERLARASPPSAPSSALEVQSADGYVAFVFDGVLDNVTGMVYVRGNAAPPSLNGEFVDATRLVVLKHFGGRWYFFATT